MQNNDPHPPRVWVDPNQVESSPVILGDQGERDDFAVLADRLGVVEEAVVEIAATLKTLVSVLEIRLPGR